MSSTIQKKKTYAVVLTKHEEDMDSGIITGRCDELHANSQGSTYGEVVQNMKEAIELMTEDLGRDKEFNITVIQEYNDKVS